MWPGRRRRRPGAAGAPGEAGEDAPRFDATWFQKGGVDGQATDKGSDDAADKGSDGPLLTIADESHTKAAWTIALRRVLRRCIPREAYHFAPSRESKVRSDEYFAAAFGLAPAASIALYRRVAAWLPLALFAVCAGAPALAWARQLALGKEDLMPREHEAKACRGAARRRAQLSYAAS